MKWRSDLKKLRKIHCGQAQGTRVYHKNSTAKIQGKEQPVR